MRRAVISAELRRAVASKYHLSPSQIAPEKSCLENISVLEEYHVIQFSSKKSNAGTLLMHRSIPAHSE